MNTLVWVLIVVAALVVVGLALWKFRKENENDLVVEPGADNGVVPGEGVVVNDAPVNSGADAPVSEPAPVVTEPVVSDPAPVEPVQNKA